MDRRKFIKSAVATVVTLALPGSTLKAAEQLMKVERGNVIIDFATKTIHLKPTVPYITPLELHRFLQSIWDEPEMMIYENPSIRGGDNFVRMENDWTMSNKSMEYVLEGTFVNGEDVYFTIKP